MKKRIIAWILAFMMVIGGVPAYTEEVVIESPAIVEQTSDAETAGNAEAEEPAAEEPATETPAAEEPAPEAPAAEEPAAEELVVEEPAAEETAAEESAVEESAEKESATEEPAVEELAEEEPAAEEPVMEEPTEEEPSTEEPAAEEPAVEESAEEEPSTEEPAAEEPVTEETVTEEEEIPSADDFTLMASEKLSFTAGYAYLSQNNARVYKAENDEEAYAYLSKGVVYAISRSNAGGSIDRIRFAFATEDGVEEMYVSASRLRPMSDEEIDAFKAEIEDAAEIHYYDDAYPVDVLEMTLAAVEPETEATKTEPVPVEPEAEATETEPVPVEPETEATETEPTPVEPETEATETEPVPVEPEAEATKTEPVPVEPETEATETEPVPVEPEAIEDDKTLSGNGENAIDLSGTRDVIGVGEKIEINALMNGESAGFAYESDDDAVAKVDAYGMITGVSVGKAAITVTAPNGEKTAFELTVKNAPSIIVFDEPSLILGEDSVHKIGYAFENDAAGQITWFSANESIVTVDANGVLTAKGLGTTAVQARAYNGAIATCAVTVMAEPSDITLSANACELDEGDDVVIGAFFTGDTYGKVSFEATSGDGEVEIVDNGDNTATIKALKSGSVTVTASVKNALKNEIYTAQCVLTIHTAVVRIELGNPRDVIGYKETVSLDPVAYDGRGNVVNTSFEYKTSNTKYITIKEDGIYGAYKGSAQVAVVAENGVSVISDITVAAAPTKVTVFADQDELAVGESMHAYASFPDGQAGAVNWRVEDASVLSIDENGLITALKKGETRIRADAYNGKYDIITLKVVEKPKSIAFEKGAYRMGEGETFIPVLNVSPLGAAAEIAYELEGSDLASISEIGAITAGTKLGTVTLRAFCENSATGELLTAECTIEIVPAPVQIVLKNNRTEIGRKETVALEPVALDGRGNEIETTFTLVSGNTRYITVSGTSIYGASVGKTTVTVNAANGASLKTSIEVANEPTKVTVASESEVLYVGAKMQLRAEFSSGQAGAVTWRVEDESILSIDEDGVVTALKIGQTRVRADAYNGKYGLITLTVASAPEAIAFEKASYQMGEGSTMKPVLIATPEDASAIANYEIVSGSDLAYVNADGSVTAGLQLGTFTLRATVRDYEKNIDVTAECAIEIIPAPVRVELIDIRTEIGYTETVAFNPVAYDGRGNVIDTNYKVSSSNTRYVSIKNGGIYGAGKGTAVITVMAENGVMTQVTITTVAAPTKVTISAPSDNMTIGETMALEHVFPDNQAGAVTWRVEDANILSIDENGVVTALSVGTTRVRVDTFNKKYAIYTLNVYPAPTSMAFVDDEIELSVGMAVEPELKLAPANAYVNPAFTFENDSQGDDAVLVEGGKIVGLAVGSGTLTVEYTCLDGTVLTDSLKVNVKPAPSTIVLDIDRAEIGVGEIFNVNPVAYDENGNIAETTFTLSTSSKSYIQVRDTEIYGAKKGSAKITVTAHNGVSVTTTFKVVTAPSKVTVAADDPIISQTGSTRVHAAFGSGQMGSVTWASSNNAIATVDANGVVIAKAVGSVMIKATSHNGKSGTITLEIKAEPTGIAFDVQNAMVGENGTRTIEARLPENCAGAVTYSTSNPYVASVDPETGLVTGVRQGETKITATTINNLTGESFTASYELTVTPEPVKIVLHIGRDEIGLKEIASLEAVAYDEFGNVTEGSLVFETSRDSYVDINQNGEIYGAKKGYSDVTVTAYNGVAVKQRFTTVAAPTSIKFDKTSVVMSEMDVITLKTELTKSTASGLIWTSSDENVVTIDEKGNVKAVSVGSCTVSVETFNGKKATCEVIVKHEPTSVNFASMQEKVGEGNSRVIQASIPEECFGAITYTSSNPDIASVDAATGTVVGLKKGVVTLTASATNRKTGEVFEDSCELTVTAKPVKIEIQVERVKIGVGETLALNAVAYDANGDETDGGFAYETSRKSYVTVDEAGNVYGVKAGYSDITVETYNGVSVKGRITVVKAPTSVAINQSSIRISEIDTYQLAMKLNDGAVGAYTWTSSDENVLTVDQNGLVTAVGFGTADVIVTTYNGKAALCAVKVCYEPETISFPEDTITVGELSTVTVEAELGDDYIGEIEYISGNESIASVDAQTGVVTGILAGKTTIIARTMNRKTGKEITGIVNVVVTPAPARVEILTKVDKIGYKETVTIEAVTYDASGNIIDGKLKLSTSNSRYLQVNSMMQMYGAARGSATVGVVAYNGVFASMKVTIASAPSSIKLNHDSINLIVGSDPVQLEAILPSGTGSTIQWETENDDTSVATVDENGLVTPVAYGTVRVRAVTFNGKYKICTVNVFEAPKSVTLSDEEITLGEEQVYTLTATLNEFAAGEITFESSSDAIATVDANGKVTAITQGTATITAKTFNGKTDTCKVVVKKAPSKVEFTVPSITIGVKQEVDVTNLVNVPEDTMASFTFVSEKSAIAKITPEGILTGVKVGSTRIKVTTHNGVYAIMSVEVKSAPTTITLIIGNANLYVGQRSEYMVQLPDGMVSEYTITSSAPEVVRVDTENNQLVAVGKGKAVITAQTYNGVIKTQVVNVLQHVESITLDRKSITLVHYETDQLIATLLPEDASDLSVIWVSSDPEKVSVDENGRIAALEVTDKPVTITVRTKDLNLSASCAVTVTPVRVSGIELNADEITLEKGRMIPMLVTITPDNADNRTLIWKSSDEKLVTVDAYGVVTAIGHEGTAKITVTSADGGFTDECIIHLSRVRMKGVAMDAFRTIVHYETCQLEPSFMPRDAEYESISFESTNENAVKVSNTGLLEAVNVGTSVIKVTVIDYFGALFTAECTVAVVPVPVTDVELSIEKLEIRAGKTEEITVSVLPDHAFNKQIVWASTNEEAATVEADPADNHKAIITAVNGGETTITATSLDSGIYDSVNVVVFDALGALLTANHNANTVGNTLIWTAEALNAIGDVSYSFRVVKDDMTAVINMTSFSDENTVVIENATAGEYVATVTVKDGLNDTATATCTINVQASQLFVSGNDTFSYVIMPGAAADGGDGAAIRYADPSMAPASVKIPAFVNGVPVVRIDTEAFMNASKLTKVSVPDTVTVIGARAFKGCVALTDMDSYTAE